MPGLFFNAHAFREQCRAGVMEVSESESNVFGLKMSIFDASVENAGQLVVPDDSVLAKKEPLFVSVYTVA